MIEPEEETGPATRLCAAVEPHAEPAWIIQRVLSEMRHQLGLEVSFVTEVQGGQRLVRFVGGETETFGLQADNVDPLEETYCDQVVRTVMPYVITDTATDPLAERLAVTELRDIGAYVGVPVRLSDGRVYGTLCALSHQAQPGLEERDVDFVRFAATIVGEQLERHELADRPHDQLRDAVQAVLENGTLRMAYQPIVDLDTGSTIGLEALARFDDGGARPVQDWFIDAWTVGLGLELELAALRAGMRDVPRLPAGTYLALNVSPDTLLDPSTSDLLAGVPGDRVVLELTEHAPFRDHEPLNERLEELRGAGFRIALDDIGTGYSTLNLLIELRPEIHKMDVSVVQGLRDDDARRALVAGMASFADTIGAVSVAEGVETEAELELLRELGVRAAQGFHIGRPGELPVGG